MKDAHKLKILQSEITNGYTKFHCKILNKNIFIKHIDNFLSADVDNSYQFFLQKALEEGLEDEKSRIITLEKQGDWTKEDDRKLNELKDFLERLKITKSKQYLKADINYIKHQIDQTEKGIKELENKKEQVTGLVAEKYANKKMNDYFIRVSCYKDPDLRENIFSEEEFDELEQEIINEILFGFNEYSSKFTSLNLKKVSLIPSYLNYFYLCDDNPYYFYGKPITKLTYFQVEVFSNAKYFKQIISESSASVTPEMLQDPDKLIEWFESNKNVKKILDKYEDKDNMNVSLVGATTEDLENLGLKATGKTINLAGEAAKKGGILTMEDMLKLQAL